eukprot:816100-Prorocentrum_minimum.AAC.2
MDNFKARYSNAQRQPTIYIAPTPTAPAARTPAPPTLRSLTTALNNHRAIMTIANTTMAAAYDSFLISDHSLTASIEHYLQHAGRSPQAGVAP